MLLFCEKLVPFLNASSLHTRTIDFARCGITGLLSTNAEPWADGCKKSQSAKDQDSILHQQDRFGVHRNAAAASFLRDIFVFNCTHFQAQLTGLTRSCRAFRLNLLCDKNIASSGVRFHCRQIRFATFFFHLEHYKYCTDLRASKFFSNGFCGAGNRESDLFNCRCHVPSPEAAKGNKRVWRELPESPTCLLRDEQIKTDFQATRCHLQIIVTLLVPKIITGSSFCTRPTQQCL